MVPKNWVQGALPDQDNLEGPIQKVSTETLVATRGTLNARGVDPSNWEDLSGMVVSSVVVALATVVMYRRIVNLLF